MKGKDPGILTYFECGHINLNVDLIGVEPVLGFRTTFKAAFGVLKDDSESDIKDSVDIVGKLAISRDMGYISASKENKIEITNQDAHDYRCRIILDIDETRKKE